MRKYNYLFSLFRQSSNFKNSSVAAVVIHARNRIIKYNHLIAQVTHMIDSG